MYVSSENVHRLELDACIIMMIRSFLNLYEATSSRLIKEVRDDKSLSEAMVKTVNALLDRKGSRGQTVDHLLSMAITLDLCQF